MASHLIYGVPATVCLLVIIALALQRTRRLHDEAERREAAEFALRQAQRLEAIGVYGFAKQSGGTATVSSSLGRGTVITLYLPRTRETPAASIAPAGPEAAAQRAGTALVVEDNPEVAEVAAAYFEQLGYSVKQVANAREALELLGNDPRIDLVFSDILMPGGMTGLELGHAIRRLYPEMPVLLTTGYSSSAQDAVREGFVVLQKPFDLAALERCAREARRAKPQAQPAQRALG